MPRHLRINAAAVIDADDVGAAPGSILLEFPSEPDAMRPLGGEILAAGEPDAVDEHPAAGDAVTLDRPGAIITPAFVNAHAHLDLTSIGPKPIEPGASFADWAAMVRASRADSAEERWESVERGALLSLRGGVVAVGDIAGAGARAPLEALCASPLIGVSFVEFFGLAERQDRAAEAMELLVSETPLVRSGVRLGLQPHAPYSAGLRVYEAAAALGQWGGVPLATHLAETLEEREFVASGEGPLRRMLESFGLWSEAILEEVGCGRTPAEHLARPLRHAPWLLAHCNDLSDDDAALLAEAQASVVYCPRAHRAFGHEARLGPHRFLELLEHGVNVALGTDSIISLPGESAKRLSPLDDAALLVGQLPARNLLRLITTSGARALSLPTEGFTLAAGPTAGIALVSVSGGGSASELLERALRAGGEVDLVGPAGLAGVAGVE